MNHIDRVSSDQVANKLFRTCKDDVEMSLFNQKNDRERSRENRKIKRNRRREMLTLTARERWYWQQWSNKVHLGNEGWQRRANK